jgi:hypothetical protein
LLKFAYKAKISFEIERTPEGTVVAFLPWASNPWSDKVVYLEQDRV